MVDYCVDERGSKENDGEGVEEIDGGHDGRQPEEMGGGEDLSGPGLNETTVPVDRYSPGCGPAIGLSFTHHRETFRWCRSAERSLPRYGGNGLKRTIPPCQNSDLYECLPTPGQRHQGDNRDSKQRGSPPVTGHWSSGLALFRP